MEEVNWHRTMRTSGKWNINGVLNYDREDSAGCPSLHSKMTASEIYRQTEQQLIEEKTLISPNDMRRRASEFERVARDFRAALRTGHPGIIAPITQVGAEPEKSGREALNLARNYVRDGAACLAVDTRSVYFNQLTAFMRPLRERIELPILQCAYTIDNYQVYQSLLLGMDAVMIPGSILGEEAEFLLVQCAHECGLQTVTLVHDASEAESSSHTGTDMIAAGNATSSGMDLTITQQVLRGITGNIAGLSFGGVTNRAELDQVASYGAVGVLVSPEFYA